MNRYEKYLRETIPKYLKNRFINEIVICDETGEDYDQIKREYGDNPKIKLYRNENRLGGFRNKIKVMSLCSSDYIALIDSDNYVEEAYFEEAIKFGLNQSSVLLPCNSEGRNSFKPLSFFNYIDSNKYNYIT
jgi:glycosyltransferase involved in cell wall biosynthesis